MAALLKVLGGKPLTHSHILGALQVLRDQTNATFTRGAPEGSGRLSCVIPKTRLEARGVDIVCERPTLAMHAQSVLLQVIDEREIKQEASTMSTPCGAAWLRAAAACAGGFMIPAASRLAPQPSGTACERAGSS